MKLTIDGKDYVINNDTRNLVDAVDSVNIDLPALCYRSKSNGGCCKACLVEIEGALKYACGTKPVDGMAIVIDRQDLNSKREEKIKAYNELSKKENASGNCNCSSQDGGCC